MKVALLITTYNWPQALALVFKSVKVQSKMPDMILIADDGSTKETRDLIIKFENEVQTKLKHFWQEDIGFRKAKILNIAIANTEIDYIIQIDGDCIIHKHFIRDHINNASKNTYLYGSRVNILPLYVNTVLNSNKIHFTIFSKEIKNKTRTLHFSFLSIFYKKHQTISKKFRGCNVSYWRSDFLEINGYNEDFEGWGREDSDLAIRLGNFGVQAKRLRYAAILYHIYHKVNLKNNLEINNLIQQKSTQQKIIRCKNGVDQYL